jgi:hypothetical protein
MKKTLQSLLLIITLGLANFSFGQTTIIDPAVSTNPNGSFENATSTPAANGWTTVNDARNKWIVNSATAFAGTNSIYITTNTGTTNDYNNGAARVSHFYRDVTFPAGETCITLSFNWSGVGETCCDHLKVYLVPTTTTPVAGTELGSGQIGGTYNQQATWQTATISIPASNAGTTQRLVFSWRNDGSAGTNPPAAVDVISLTSTAPVTPTYATLGYIQDFEAWTSSCGAGINDLPSTNWAANPSTGNNSWRREDQGVSTGGWSGNSGLYSPVYTTTAHSARFHSYNATSGTQGNIDLYLDCSPAGTKTLTFDYINTSGTDILEVLQSTNGGSTFPTTLGSYAVNGSWVQKSINITTTSATTVIRFRATSDYGGSDIGIDNLKVLLPCAGTPTAGTATATPASICLGATSTLSVAGYSIASGISFQWQSSPNPVTVWTNISGATGTSYIASPTASTNYRCVITCANSGLSANSSVALVTLIGLPTYATIPYTQSFEGPWLSVCDTRESPDNSWLNTPRTGNTSWRRNDDGAAAVWTSPASGIYTPVFTDGAKSARFHSYNTCSGSTIGSLDLYVNLSPAGNKSLCFDYINTSGTDIVELLLSTDGGVTFPTTLLSLSTASVWTSQTVTVASNSATCVLRFRADGDCGSTDIGLDNLSLSLPSVPNCATYTSPANGATNISCGIDAIMNWTAPTVTACNPATSYDVYFGTAASPPFVVNQTGLMYNPGTLLPSTTYYWRIVPRNSAGAAACATVWSFVTGASYSPSQTSPPISDGFENCLDWTVVNGAQANKWLRGTTASAVRTGSYAMYINNTGSNNNYNVSSSSVVHFYKDIVFPAGSNDYDLNFYWKGEGESTVDYLRVYLAPTTEIPLAGTLVNSSYSITPYIYNFSGIGIWQYYSNTLSIVCAGNETKRLIFSWRNDGSVGTQPPAAVDDIEVVIRPRTGTTCANPVNITLPYTATAQTTQCMGDNYNNTAVPCAGNNYVLDQDKVYKAVIGAAGCVNVNITNASSNSIGFQVYDGCPDAGGNCIYASSTGATGGTLTTDINIPAPGFYYIIVDSWNAPGDYVNYDINISAPGGNTLSDPCTGAIPLTLGVASAGDNTCTNAVGEPAAPACWTSGVMNTVWYRVTIPASNDLLIKTAAGSLLKTQIDFYRGNSCAGLTYIDCNQDAASCGTSYDHSQYYLENIGAGTYLYIRVDGENNLVGTFSITAFDGNNVASPVLPPVPGQDCGPVLTHTYPVCGQNNYVPNPGNFAFGNICDFTGAGPLCLASGEKSSTWYTININANGTLAFDIVPNDWPGSPSTVATDYDWALWRWEAACDGLGDNTFCCAEISAGTTAATRCNYSSLGVTGMYTTTGTAPPAYPGFGSAYEANLAVTNGEIYVLVISNYKNDYASGYTLNFSAGSPIAYSTPGATMTWASSTSNTWISAGNWGGCGPPNCGINGVIAAGGAQPIISSNVTVKDLTIDAGATLTINAGVTLTVCGNLTNNGTLIAAPTSTILFDNASVVHTISGNLTGTNKLGNLTINKTGGSVVLACNLDIGGNFTTQNTTSILNVDNYYLKVGGNFSTAANTTITNCPTIEFNGVIPQTYRNNSGVLTFPNVVMNNTGGGMVLTGTTTSNLYVSTLLTLTNGIIYTANPPLLVMNAGSASTSGSALSFVDGPMDKIGNTAFVFPVGDAFNRWMRIGISAPTASTTFRAQYFYTPYSNITTMAVTPTPVLNNVSAIEYWQLDRVGGAANASVTLYWENAASSGINSCAALQGGDLVVARWNGAAWENRSNTIVGGITGTCGTFGTVTSDVLTAFSPFTFSSKSPIVNPLPVELLSFTGKNNAKENVLEWVTATEVNNDFFTLERGTDGYTFEEIATVKGAGNSHTIKSYKSLDKEPLNGINYYRLKQTDVDGTVKYAPNVIALRNEKEIDYTLYPNPVNKELVIYADLMDQENINITITDISGRKVMEQKQFIIGGGNAVSINTSQFSEGIYFVLLKRENSIMISQKKFVKMK